MHIKARAERHHDAGPLPGAELVIEVIAAPRLTTERLIDTGGDSDGPERLYQTRANFDLRASVDLDPVVTGDDGTVEIVQVDEQALDSIAAAAEAAGRDAAAPHQDETFQDVVLAARPKRATWAGFTTTTSAVLHANTMSRQSGARPGARFMFDRNGTVPIEFRLDTGFIIVGETTGATSRIAYYAGRKFEHPVEITYHPISNPGASTKATMAPIVNGEVHYRCDLTGLTSATDYAFSVALNINGADFVLSIGKLRTPDPDRVKLTFASCSEVHNHPQFELWERFASQDSDLNLLLGDQIYETGIDTTPSEPSPEAWFELYADAYWSQWRHESIRTALASRANYMVLDDHDVADDLGTVNVEESEEDRGRRHGALDAYTVFQQAHSTQDRHPDHHFRFGPAAFYLLDTRTQRDPAYLPPHLLENLDEPINPNATPDWSILGREQRARLADFLDGPARDADIVFIGTSIPIAWISVQKVLDLLKELKNQVGDFVAGASTLLVSGLPGVLGGFTSWLFGGSDAVRAVGSISRDLGFGWLANRAEEFFEDKARDILTEADMADLWEFPAHQQDLRFVLDRLFDFTNDIDPRTNAQRPNPEFRPVYILSGDVHLGGTHVITSHHRRHRHEPEIYQITSSAIANDPPDPLVRNLIEHLSEDTKVDLDDWQAVLAKAALQQWFWDETPLSDRHGKGDHTLDAQLPDPKYTVRRTGELVAEKNFGTITVEVEREGEYRTVALEAAHFTESSRRRALSKKHEVVDRDSRLTASPSGIEYDNGTNELPKNFVILIKWTGRTATTLSASISLDGFAVSPAKRDLGGRGSAEFTVTFYPPVGQTAGGTITAHLGVRTDTGGRISIPVKVHVAPTDTRPPDGGGDPDRPPVEPH